MSGKRSLPTKRATAAAIGAPHYFTGKVCKHGHLSKRHTHSGHCMECNRIAGATPAGLAKTRRYFASPKGREAKRRYNHSPSGGLEAMRRYDASPLGAEKKRRHKSTQKCKETQRLYDAAQHTRINDRRNRRRREVTLDRALDVFREDYDPARAARLLANWSART